VELPGATVELLQRIQSVRARLVLLDKSYSSVIQITDGLYYCIVLQLRQTVFQFAQKELAPKAADIDSENTFKEMRVSIHLHICDISAYSFVPAILCYSFGFFSG